MWLIIYSTGVMIARENGKGKVARWKGAKCVWYDTRTPLIQIYSLQHIDDTMFDIQHQR